VCHSVSELFLISGSALEAARLPSIRTRWWVEVKEKTVGLPRLRFFRLVFDTEKASTCRTFSCQYICNLQQRLAAMSFDQYFESTRKQSHRSQSSDDWYAIVEEALYAADVVSRQHRQQLELSLMKPLPMIPEDDTDWLDLTREITMTGRSNSITATPKSVESQQRNISWTDEQRHYNLETPTHHSASRRPSSVYSTELDSPLSQESSDLDTWASDVCSTAQSGMSSLRSKPYSRQSNYTSSALSERCMSTGSSVVVRRPQSNSSSVYSTDASVDSPGGSPGSICTHSRSLPEDPAPAPRKLQSEKTSRASISFFDFSDDEKEEELQGEEVTVARAESSASSYVEHLRKTALSLRITTSKIAQARVRTFSLPMRDGPALSTWLHPSQSSSVDRSSMLAFEHDIALENGLMVGAAVSAKAKRVLGLK
jgi:hypothetical protein